LLALKTKKEDEMKRLLILPFILIYACKKVENQEKQDGNVIAVVGDIKITNKDLQIGLENFPGIELTKEQKETLKDELIKTAVFYLAAKDEKFDTNSNLNLKIEWIKRSIIAQEFLKNKFGNRMPSETEIENYINSNISKFSKKADVIIVQFFDTTLKAEIRDLLLDLNRTPVAGKKLDDMVKKGILTAQPISMNLGIAEFDFSDSVIDILKKSKSGDVLGPYKIPNGYSYIKVIEIKDDNPKSPQIKQALFQIFLLREQQKFMDSLYQALKTKYIK
jgi:hypothetical protein